MPRASMSIGVQTLLLLGNTRWMPPQNEQPLCSTSMQTADMLKERSQWEGL